MKRAAFYAHLTAAILFIDGPLWNTNWALGLVALPLIVLVIEIAYGLFNDFFDALIEADQQQLEQYFDDAYFLPPVELDPVLNAERN